jgi:hypothetical protein
MVVEILRQSGGLAPRALLGGSFTPGTGSVVINVGVSEPAGEVAATCQSQLWKPLIPGVPSEFAEAAMAGIVRRQQLPGGLLVVDRGAHDRVESSPLAFELAGELFVSLVASELAGTNLEVEARRLIEAWP